MVSNTKDKTMTTKRKLISRNLLVAALLIGGLLATAGCDEEIGLADSFYGYGWDDGYGGNDGFYSNWYTDTTINGDDTGFYIAGDGFTYTSGW